MSVSILSVSIASSRWHVMLLGSTISIVLLPLTSTLAGISAPSTYRLSRTKLSRILAEVCSVMRGFSWHVVSSLTPDGRIDSFCPS